MRPDAIARAGWRATRTALLAAETFGRARSAEPRRAPLRSRLALLEEAAREALQLHDVHLHVDGEMPPGPAVIVANHRGWLDPLVLLALRGAVPVAKAEVRAWPIVGQVVAEVGCLFVDRDDPWSGARVIRQAIRLLERGASVLGFPEGTTTRHGVRPFKRGLFGAARVVGVPVVPVAITVDDDVAWVGDDPFLPHWLHLCQRGPIHVRVRVGLPVLVPANVEPALVAARTRDMLARAIDVDALVDHFVVGAS